MRILCKIIAFIMIVMVLLLEYALKITLMIPIGLSYVIGFIIYGESIHNGNGYAQKLWQYCTQWNPFNGGFKFTNRVSDRYW